MMHGSPELQMASFTSSAVPDGATSPMSRQRTVVGAGLFRQCVIGRATGRSLAGAPAASASRSPASRARMTAARSFGVSSVNSAIAPSLSRTVSPPVLPPSRERHQPSPGPLGPPATPHRVRDAEALEQAA